MQAAEELHVGGGGNVWSEEELGRFARGDTKTTELAGLILDVLADLPEDQPLTLDEIAQTTKLPRSQVKTLWDARRAASGQALLHRKPSPLDHQVGEPAQPAA